MDGTKLVTMLTLLIALASPALAEQEDERQGWVPVHFRLPAKEVWQEASPESAATVNAYKLAALPSGCSKRAVTLIQPYDLNGAFHLSPECDWRLSLILGERKQSGGEELLDAYYETAELSLRRTDLLGKRGLEVAFQFRLLKAGEIKGLKPSRLSLN